MLLFFVALFVALSVPPFLLLFRPFREKRLSPRRASKQALLPHSPKRTQVRLKPLLSSVQLRRLNLSAPTDGLQRKSTVCG